MDCKTRAINPLFGVEKGGSSCPLLTRETPCRMMTFLTDAPLAQLDRALDYESSGQRFESSRARHFIQFEPFFHSPSVYQQVKNFFRLASVSVRSSSTIASRGQLSPDIAQGFPSKARPREYIQFFSNVRNRPEIISSVLLPLGQISSPFKIE